MENIRHCRPPAGNAGSKHAILESVQSLTPDPSPEARCQREAGDPWYAGVSAAQWQVLGIASAGWIFDSYAAQIFNVTRNVMLAELLRVPPGDPRVKFWGEILLGIYLVGGAIGGTYFGSLADRIGRRKAMAITIVTYTLFCGLNCLAVSAWQVAFCRFVVAMGTAGAWAVGASLVAEVFSARSRSQAGAIFHATSNIGTWMASLVGMAVGLHWRLGYLTGAIPMVLVFWLRTGDEEAKSRRNQAAAAPSQSRHQLHELLATKRWRSRAILGMLLAAVALGTYWCIAVGGQDLVQAFLIRHGYAATPALKRAQFAYGFLINGGGFVGSIAFGPFAQWLGRRRAFSLAMIGGVLVVPTVWYLPQTYTQLLFLLPIYGCLTFGYHSGFAFYFPELFPTHLRGTGAGFCFNGGRLLAAVILGFSGWLKSRPGLELRAAASLLALLYLFGLVCLKFLPETKNEKLVAAP